MASLFSHQRPKEGTGAARDIVALGVALTALLLFLKISDGFVLQLGRQLAQMGSNNGNIIVGLLLLNVALTIYGWRRYRDAAREVVERTAAEKRASTLALLQQAWEGDVKAWQVAMRPVVAEATETGSASQGLELARKSHQELQVSVQQALRDCEQLQVHEQAVLDALAAASGPLQAAT